MKPHRLTLLLLVLCTVLTPATAERARTSRGDGPGLPRLKKMGYNGPVKQTPAPALRGGGLTLWVAPPPLGSNANNGMSSTTPFQTIQFAFAQAGTLGADTIRVLPGTYNECINNTAFAIGSQLNLNVVADDFLVNGNRGTTIIDGNGACAEPFSVVNLAGTGTPGSRLEGFTIRNAADSGVFVIGSGIVTENIITANTGLDGGGVFVYPGTCYYGQSAIQITNNTITNNTADDQGSCNPGGEPCSMDSQCPTTGATCGILGGNGGGVYVRGAAVNGGGTIGCIGGDARVTISNNVIDGNGADFAFGGGMYVKTDAQTGRLSTVTITQNLISNNTTLPFSLGYGGGAWIGTFGYGTEEISFDDNTVSTNATTGDGGGVSAWVDTQSQGNHTITVTNNDVVSNTAEGAGGGMDLFQISREVAGGKGALTVTDNLIDNNDALGTNPSTFSPGIGGGAVINAWSEETLNALSGIQFLRNEVTNNTAFDAGGGVGAIVRADADHADDGNTNDARSDAAISNNLIALNTASSGAGSVGGGIFALVHAEGEGVFPAISTLSLDFNTVTQNSADGGAGGIELESYTIDDANGASGDTAINLRRSIVFDNSGWGVGGPALGGNPRVTVADWLISPPANFRPNTASLTLVNQANNLFMNTAGGYEPTLPVNTTPGVDQIGMDPLLGASFVPTVCSPTIDAGPSGNPPGNEPAPNGGRFNLGHTGGTSAATKSLTDPNGDGIVDGVDVLRLAVAFASSNGDTRYDASVDLDGDGFVGPIDLVLMATNYAVNCN